MSGQSNGQLAYIGLGSNLDNPLQQVTDAVEDIEALPRTTVLSRSHWYRSAPVGPGTQPDYINGVVAVNTMLEPRSLLTRLQDIEAMHGRQRTVHWGPRTLDLDILLYGKLQINTPELQIPHPHLASRNFVLYPLADLTNNLVLPDGRSLKQLLANVSAQGIVRL